MTTNLDNNTLEWAAQWIEGSVKGETDHRVREFSKNMATTLRAAKLDDSRASVDGVVTVDDKLVDEVQHRMDQVVDAAVEWHQDGREGGEWMEAADKLANAIDSLLELRSHEAETTPKEESRDS